MPDIDESAARYERDFERDVITRLTRIEANAATAATTSTDHETRIRDLEYKAWRNAGITGVLSFTIAIVGEWFARHWGSNS